MAVIGCGNRVGPGVRRVRAAVERAVGGRRRSEQGEARFVDDARAADVQARHGRRLPAHPRSQGRRRGADRHAGSLAQPADHRCDLRRQGRLRREAGVEHGAAAERHARRLPKGKQVVQVGTQQRSWDHFMEAKKILDSGVLGNVTHIYIVQPGSYARPKEAEQPVPAGLDWDMWQGPAPKKAFKPSRLGFRALVRLRRRAGGGLGRAPRRRGPLVHERRHARCRSRPRQPARFSRCPMPIPNRCPTRSRSPGSTTSSS